MNVVILGCGRVGARVACAMSPSNDVTVIDWNPPSFERLGGNFQGVTVTGNGIDIEVLRAARVSETDVFVAATNGDNRNLMAAQIALHLGAKRVIARVYDAERCDIFRDMGMITLSPTVLGSDRLFAMVLNGGEDG